MSWQAPGYAHRLDLGGGKAGQAFLAATEDSGELVVIKYLNVEASAGERVRADLLELSTLDSPYFVTVREVIQSDDGVAIVMDPVNGVTLRALLRDGGAISAEAALLIFYETLAGLTAVHRAGFAHGDYRPENVLLSLDGRPVLLDARAASWIDRDITLSTGVYLAPERWHSDALTPAADVYAATVTFAEMLMGEPPYWEDSQLLALRYRHEQEEIPLVGVPIGLRELLRLGMAKDVAARADADALLAVVEMTAIAEYGSEWAESARAGLVELLASRQTALGGLDVIEATEVASGELVELDDYYSDLAAGGVAAGAAAAAGVAAAGAEAADSDADAAGAEALSETDVEAIEVSSAVGEADLATAEVVAAASEIVELVSIEEVTAAAAAPVEDVLTEDEERAVAEVESLVAAVETGEAVGTVVVEGMDIAATEAELAEIDETVIESTATSLVFESDNAAGAFAEGAVAEGLIAEGAAAGGVIAGELAEAEQAGVVTGVAKVPAPPVAAGEARVPFRRRHPWLVGMLAILIVIVVAGVAFGLTGGRAGGPSTPSTPQAAITETPTNGGVLPPVSKSPGTPAVPVVASSPSTPGTPAGSPSAPSAGPATSPAAPGSTPSSHQTHRSHKPKPSPTPTKLPVTGSSTGYTFGLAGLLLAAGIALVVGFRRRRA